MIADDSLLMRRGLARLLEDDGFEVVGEAAEAEDLLRKVGAHRPDVALVDVRMPPGFSDEGLRAARTIRETWPEVGVLVLSERLEQVMAIELFADGTDGLGYLLKQRVTDLEGFGDAIRRVGHGGSALDPRVVSQLLGRRREEQPLERLTAREGEVLSLVAEGLSNLGIADRLTLSGRGVEKHITNAYEKLELGSEPFEHRRVRAALMHLAGVRQ